MINSWLRVEHIKYEHLVSHSSLCLYLSIDKLFYSFFYTDRLSDSRKWGKVFIIRKQFSSWENSVRFMKCLLNKKEEKVCVPWAVLGDKSWHQIFINHLTINIELFQNKKKMQHFQQVPFRVSKRIQDWYGLCCNKICKSAWRLFNFGNGYLGKQ